MNLIPNIKTPGGREYRFPKDAIYKYEHDQLKNRKGNNKKPKKKRKALSTHNKKWRVE